MWILLLIASDERWGVLIFFFLNSNSAQSEFRTFFWRLAIRSAWLTQEGQTHIFFTYHEFRIRRITSITHHIHIVRNAYVVVSYCLHNARLIFRSSLDSFTSWTYILLAIRTSSNLQFNRITRVPAANTTPTGSWFQSERHQRSFCCFNLTLLWLSSIRTQWSIPYS